jgi:hypothetical protein
MESSEWDCGCSFEECEFPVVYFSRASNGAFVVWSNNSIEADIISLLNIVWGRGMKISEALFGHFRDQTPIADVDSSCPVCQYASLDLREVMDHLSCEAILLAKDLKDMLDTRQLSPGKFRVPICLSR